MFSQVSNLISDRIGVSPLKLQPASARMSPALGIINPEENKPYDPRKHVYDLNSKETTEEFEKRMKDEYKKNFIDINFYGYQSKIPNPMSSPTWRFKGKESLNVDAENEALRKLAEERQRLAKTATGFKFESAPVALGEAKSALLDRFKDNVEKLQSKRASLIETKGLVTNNAGKYKHLLTIVEQAGQSRNTSPSSDMYPFEKKNSSFSRPKGKLWTLIDKLKCQKGEELDVKEKIDRK